MKRFFIWSTLLVTSLLGIGVINLLLYEQAEEVYQFPIPKNAELYNQKEFGNQYTWSKASEENGIPFGYEVVLWLYGWEKGQREGASVLYTNGNHTINLISLHNQLDIIKVTN